MRIDVSGKRVIVTGASSGLGASAALALAAAGAEVVAAARRLEALEAIAERSGGRVRAVALDVTDPLSAKAAVAEAAAALGGLDGLVNNAGVAAGGRTIDLAEAEWRRVMDVNLDGAFRVAQAAAREMMKGGGGSIVNIASVLGIGTAKGVAAYSASKAALMHLTKVLALEWGPKRVRVNAIAPGYIPTELNDAYLSGPAGDAIAARTPLGRLGRPEDLHGSLALLLSDASAYVTGAVLPVDGGHLVAPL